MHQPFTVGIIQDSATDDIKATVEAMLRDAEKNASGRG